MNQITAVLMSYVAPGLWAASTVSGADHAMAVALGQPLLRVDLTDVSDKATLMEALARDLGFGEYFGKNFDALEECLLDLDTHANLNVGPAAVVLEHGELLIASVPEVVSTLNQILGDVSTVSGLSFIWIGEADGVPLIPNVWR